MRKFVIMTLLERLRQCDGFDWDEHNYYKNWIKHNVSPYESEEALNNNPLFLDDDVKHSQSEERYLAYGKTNLERPLLISFTFRGNKVRVISARQMDKKERKKTL